jgi:hypothetical protein
MDGFSVMKLMRSELMMSRRPARDIAVIAAQLVYDASGGGRKRAAMPMGAGPPCAARL